MSSREYTVLPSMAGTLPTATTAQITFYLSLGFSLLFFLSYEICILSPLVLVRMGCLHASFKMYGIRAGQIMGGCVYPFHGHSLAFSVVGILAVYLSLIDEWAGCIDMSFVSVVLCKDMLHTCLYSFHYLLFNSFCS